MRGWSGVAMVLDKLSVPRRPPRERESLRSPVVRGWSGGSIVLDKVSVPRRPTNLDNSRARAYWVCSRCGRGLLDFFSLVYLFSFFFSLCGRRPDMV